MQRILIPTDFSPIADNAFNYAIELATKFKSELYLYHVFHWNKKLNYDWNLPDDEQPFVKSLEEKMDSTKQKFIEKINQNGLKIKTVVEDNDVFSLFRSVVVDNKIDLIVMGSKGATGLDKVIFGSVAATAIEMAEVPVLVIPPSHTFNAMQHIVLASKIGVISANILLPLQNLAFRFGAKVTILSVKTDSSKEVHQKIDSHLQDVETSLVEVPLSVSINESINNYVQENQCDLLCMIRIEKGFFESIFKTSVIKTQVYENTTPLLIMPQG